MYVGIQSFSFELIWGRDIFKKSVFYQIARSKAEMKA
jgi:hypothetical protein